MKLKVLLLFSAVMCCTAGGFAQQQNGFLSFFGQESTKWNGVTGYYDVPWNNHILRITDDTLIGDNRYFKKVEYSTVNWYSGYSGRDSSLDFFLREDTATGKLWCRFQDEDDVFIIADMSLSLGDTIWLPNYVGYRDSVMYTVQDTFTQDGHYTISLIDDFSTRSIMFIEGVGCSNLFDYLRLHIVESQIVCCHKDGELFYHWDVEGLPEEDCVVHAVGTDGCNESRAVHVWPNPCNDWIYINSDEHIKTAKIHDLTGRLLLDKINCLDKVSLKDLPQGVYLLYVETSHSESVITIIKQ